MKKVFVFAAVAAMVSMVSCSNGAAEATDSTATDSVVADSVVADSVVADSAAAVADSAVVAE